MKWMIGLLLGCGLLGAGCTASESPAGPTRGESSTARYRVTFEATWSAATHPVDFPPGAHFSALVGATHGASVTFWRDGAPASDGIRDMAERGRTTPLDREVTAAIDAGTAEHLLIGGAIGQSPGSVALTFDIGQAFPLVTLVSMIAPSPDWFVGVSRLPLLENGRWVPQRRVDLDPWDAGTDSGSTFTSPDRVTSPRQPVFRILTEPLSPGGRVTPLGTFAFTRLSDE